MLVIDRDKDEVVKIGDNIEVMIVGLKGKTVRLGITAPDDVKILRDDAKNTEAKK